MRRRIRGALTALLCLTFAGASRPPGQQLTLHAESQLWFDGKSTLRDWSCKATAIESAIESAIDANGAMAVAEVLNARKAVKAATLTFPTAKLDCDNGRMNGHMLKALKATAHPDITFAMADYELTAAVPVVGQLRGTLTINGVARSVTFPATFEAGPAGALRVTGSYALDMTAWGVAPPKLMLGTLKVRELVTVGFNLLLQH